MKTVSHFVKNVFCKPGIALIPVISMFAACSKNGNAGSNNPPAPTIYNAQVTVNATEELQTIRGFGCASAFTPPGTTPMTNEEMGRLFGNNNGQIGLNIFRIRIGTDDAWRNTELNYSKEAIKYGAKIMASPWSPPARMKTSNNIVKGKLIPDSAAAYAKYLNDFALYMQANGAPVYALSVQNEPDWEPDYEGCVWTATEMRDFIKNHGASITAAKLVAPELVNNNPAYINTIMNDDAAMANLDILATHIYGGGVVANATAKAKGKEYWMTEHLDTAYNYAACLTTANEIHDCLTTAGFNAYIWWYGKRFYGLIGQDGAVTKRGYVMAQFSKFIKEGSVRIGTGANSRNEVLVSAYKNGSKKIVVVINLGTAQVNQKIDFQNAVAGSFIPYITTETKNVEAQAAVTASANSLTCAIPARSMVTIVEQ